MTESLGKRYVLFAILCCWANHYHLYLVLSSGRIVLRATGTAHWLSFLSINGSGNMRGRLLQSLTATTCVVFPSLHEFRFFFVDGTSLCY